MKMQVSLCQMIAIVCILAVGFMTVTPFVQTADAWPSHLCCETIDVWQKIYSWGAVKTGQDYVWGYVPTNDCDDVWHWKVWPHWGTPCD